MGRDSFFRYFKSDSGYVLSLKIWHGERTEAFGVVNYSYVLCAPMDLYNPRLDFFKQTIKNMKTSQARNLRKFAKMCEEFCDWEWVTAEGIFNKRSKLIAQGKIEANIKAGKRIYSFETEIIDGKLEKPIVDCVLDDMAKREDIHLPQNWM